MNKKQIAILGQMFDAVSLLIQGADLQEPDAVRLSAFYKPWAPGESLGNNEWRRYGTNPDGKPLLWSTTKNINGQQNTVPPNESSGFKLLG